MKYNFYPTKKYALITPYTEDSDQPKSEDEMGIVLPEEYMKKQESVYGVYWLEHPYFEGDDLIFEKDSIVVVENHYVEEVTVFGIKYYIVPGVQIKGLVEESFEEYDSNEGDNEE